MKNFDKITKNLDEIIMLSLEDEICRKHLKMILGKYWGISRKT